MKDRETLALHTVIRVEKSDTTVQLDTHTHLSFAGFVTTGGNLYSCSSVLCGFGRVHNPLCPWKHSYLNFCLSRRTIYQKHRLLFSLQVLLWEKNAVKGHMNILSLEKYIPCINQSSSFQIVTPMQKILSLNLYTDLCSF